MAVVEESGGLRQEILVWFWVEVVGWGDLESTSLFPMSEINASMSR